MKSENNEKRESAKDNNKKSEEQKDNTKSQNNERIKRQIKSFQKNNKQKVRFYGNINSWMRDRTKKLAEERENVTAFERFMGTKKEDFRSGYDENAIEANNTDTSKEIKLEEEDAYGK